MKGHKIMTAALIILVAILGFSGVAKADDGNFTNVEINGYGYEANTTIGVYVGDTLDINFDFLTGNYSGDLEFEAYVTGTEDDVEDKTEIEVDVYRTYEESLTLELPDDMDITNNETNYTIVLKAITEDDVEIVMNWILDVQLENTLEIYDVLLTPGSNVEAGQTLLASIGVKNLGEAQENVRVYMEVPELDLSTKTTLFDLLANGADSEDDDDYKLYKSLALAIPSNAAAGEYEVLFSVVYEDGDEVVTESSSLIVNGGAATIEDVVISVDVQAQDIIQGRGAVYKLLFANLGSSTTAYTVELSDVSAWGTARADPLTLTVGPEATGEMYIFVSSDEESELGVHQFTVTINSGDSVVEVLNLDANIVEQAQLSGWGEVRLGLEIGFAVLLVILVILGIVLVAKKLGRDEDGEEPLIEEGQSYY